MENADEAQTLGIDFPLDVRRLKWFERHQNCGASIEIYDCLIGPEEEPGVFEISASVNCVKCCAGEYIRDQIPVEHVLEVLEKVLRGTANCARHDPRVKLCVDRDTWMAIRKFQEREECQG